MQNGISPYYSPIVLVAMVTIGPVWEELFFREILIGKLSEYIPIWVCIAVSLLIFTSVHLAFPLFGLITGGIFTLTYLYTRSLFAVIILHLLSNVYIVFQTIA
ncbi:CPBP family intramembrane metalloprotease [Virgibacillus halodenitrificans]|uniref:CPBP family intramembrane glutamic endopeptidase n=1 Tax=Virgibacillus halodenitrificans TaxID=1482 RepID=UPI001FB26634|nr:CPBP family intramembrane glutamic endopeptidase [Virgibacillus halodenitrificans]MCJ0930505.1 CPBP family intramembrane metalloprotease [Virgibacillus halodenitrificans]